ncbi:MAG: pyridoxal phosphate-dependent aminotransferase [Gammaproteobacteria bacterium]|nr:pyridoxal phosphate-dependent aminotransferase [Gammaproteobacteria bacterium]
MLLQISQRAQALKPSPTLAVTARAKALRAAGRDIIDLGAGEPDFDTPQHIKDAAIQAINNGFTKYTEVDGTPGLKQAIITKFKRDNALDYKLDQILVSNGGKHSFYNLAQALINVGDEAIIPAPYWVSYPPMIELANGVPIILETGLETGFKITPEQLDAAITPRTRMVVLNSPSNPTGAVYTQQEFAQLGEVLRAYPHVLVVTDDIYEGIIWDRSHYGNILAACPDLYDRTMVLNGVSKAYSMTGWRIGYAAGPKGIISAMKNVQSQSTSNPASISQVAAQTALEGDQSFISEMARVFKQRHDVVLKGLNQLKDVRCIGAQGAFYLFPNVQAVINSMPGINDDVGLAELLLDKAGVALVPGSAFGAPGYLRLSFATSMEFLNESLDRLKKVLG